MSLDATPSISNPAPHGQRTDDRKSMGIPPPEKNISLRGDLDL